MKVLDLFSGTGSATEPFLKDGHEVISVDIDSKWKPTILTDVKSLHLKGSFEFVWASPPCIEFARESMPWCRTGKPPDLSLIEATINIIRSLNPHFWIIENVRGAQRFVHHLLGPVKKKVGPFYLWGDFPIFDCTLNMRKKESYGSKEDWKRAMIPPELSRAIYYTIVGA